MIADDKNRSDVAKDPLFHELKHKFKNRGITKAERYASGEKLLIKKMEKLSKSANLSDLEKEYVLFSHGAWFIYGSADYDPLLDFLHENKIVGEIAHVTTVKQIFSNLDKDRTFDIDWNRTIVCCSKELWPKLESFLMQIAFIQHEKSFFFQTTLQQIPVLDMNIRNETPIKELKTVNIKVFGLDSNKGLVIARPTTNGLIEFALAPAKQSTIELANSILNYKSDEEVADKMDQSYKEEKEFKEKFESSKENDLKRMN